MPISPKLEKIMRDVLGWRKLLAMIGDPGMAVIWVRNLLVMVRRSVSEVDLDPSNAHPKPSAHKHDVNGS